MVQAAEATTEQMHVMSGDQAVSAVHQRGNREQQGQQARKSRDTLKNQSHFKSKLRYKLAVVNIKFVC